MIRTLIAAALLVSATASQAIDLAVYNNTDCPTIVTAMVGQHLVNRTTVTDPATQQVTTTDAPAPGVDYVPWQGTGKFMTAAAVLDVDGNVTTPATYLPGCLELVRLSGDTAASDAITPDPADPNKAEQFSRSKFALKLKANGTPGVVAGIHYWKIGAFFLTRFQDLQDFVTAHGFSGHEWAGGNSP